MCGNVDEVSACNELAQNEYKKLRHDKVAALLQQHWCKTYGYETHEKYCEHFVEKEFRVLQKTIKLKSCGTFQYDDR